MAGLAAYVPLIRPWHLRWGATKAEVNRTLPGDNLVRYPKLRATHAVTIKAPVTNVWPWLVQIGQGRGGFYSYDWIENLMGLNIHSVGRIVPELQNLTVGDVIPLAPDGTGPPVVVLEPNRVLVLGGRIDTNTKGSMALEERTPDAYFEASWAFFLEPVDDRTTRLIEHFQADWNPPNLKNWFSYRVFLEPGSFIMERKMLLGIKQRAEAAVSGSAGPAQPAGR